MALHFKSVTEIPVSMGPAQGGLCAWSEDNVIAYCSQRKVTLLHARRLQEGQMIAALDLGNKLPYFDRKGGENSLQVNLAAMNCVSYRVLEDKKLFYDFAKGVCWSPAGLAPDGGCVLIVVNVSGQVLLFGRPPGTRDVSWTVLSNLSEQLGNILKTSEGVDWLKTLAACDGSGRLRGGAGAAVNVASPADRTDVEMHSQTSASPQQAQQAPSPSADPAAAVPPAVPRRRGRSARLVSLAGQPAPPTTRGAGAAGRRSTADAPSAGAAQRLPAGGSDEVGGTPTAATPQPTAAALGPSAEAMATARMLAMAASVQGSPVQGGDAQERPGTDGAGRSSAAMGSSARGRRPGRPPGRGKRKAAGTSTVRGSTEDVEGGDSVAGGDGTPARGHTRGGRAGRAAGRRGGGRAGGRGRSAQVQPGEDALADRITAHTDLSTAPAGDPAVPVEALPAGLTEDKDLSDALRRRLVRAFHTLHTWLSTEHRAEIADLYLRTSNCRRVPLSLRKPHEKLAQHAAAAVFHACKSTLASRSGDSNWSAQRLLDEHDASLRTYVQLTNWVRLNPLKSGRFYMPDINTEAETPLYAQAVAAVWLRMLETMHARKREIAAATVQRAAPSEADLADDGIHQALTEFCYRHGMVLVEGGLLLSDVSKPIRERVRTFFRGSRTIMRSDMGGQPYVAPRSSVTAQLGISAPERWPEYVVSGLDGDQHLWGTEEDEKPYRPSPDFQEPCDLVPADLVPPRDAPAALMDNDGIAVLAAPGKPAEGTQTDGPAQRPPVSVSAAQAATDAAPSAHVATAAAPAAGGARRSTRVRKAVLTTAPIVDAASDSSSDSGGGAAATDSDATVDSKDEPEDEDDGDSDQDDSLSADEGVAALTGRRSGGAATQAAAAASDDDRSAGEGTIGDSGTEDEMPEAGGKPLWQQRMRKGGYGTGLNASRARHVAKVSGMSWERFRNGKLPAGFTAEDFPDYSISQKAVVYCEKVDKAEKLARIKMSVSDLLTAPNERTRGAPQAAQALCAKLLMSTCAAAAPLPTGADGSRCCAIAVGTRSGHVVLWHMRPGRQPGACVATEERDPEGAPCTLAGAVLGCAAGAGLGAPDAVPPRALPPVTAVAWVPGTVKVALGDREPPREAPILLVGTARGGVSAFAVVAGAHGADPPPAAAPVGASFPQPATLCAVPLGVAVPPGLSPVAMLAAQTLCAADVPSLQHAFAPADGPGADEHAEVGEEQAWQDRFPGQPLGEGGATRVIAVAMGTAAGEVTLCCRELAADRVVHPAAQSSGEPAGAAAFGTLAAPVRPPCMACTTGLVMTAMGSVCASFSATQESIESAGGSAVCCWQLHCATASAAGAAAGPGGAPSTPLRCWLKPVDGGLMYARMLLPNGMLTSQPRDTAASRKNCTVVTGLAAPPSGLFVLTVSHAFPHRALVNPGTHACGSLQLQRTFTFRPRGDAASCTRHLHCGALAARAALRAALDLRAACGVPLPAAALWEVASALAEGLAYDVEALAVDLETTAVQRAADKQSLQALERELEKNNTAAAAEQLRKPEVEEEVLASHAEMVAAVWAWLTAAGAGPPADGPRMPLEACSMAHAALQARVACARVAYALLEEDFGPVKVMHAAPACFDGGSGKPHGALTALQARLCEGLGDVELQLLTGHIETSLKASVTDTDPEAASRRLLLCDAVACMNASAVDVPATLVDTARKLLSEAGESMEGPRPQREIHELLGTPLAVGMAPPASVGSPLPPVRGLRYVQLQVGEKVCTVPRCAATLSGNPERGGRRCAACVQPYPRAWLGACIYCGVRVTPRGVLKQLDVPTLL